MALTSFFNNLFLGGKSLRMINMAKKLFDIVCLFLAMLQISDGALQLDVTQPNLPTCLQGPLIVNCTFSHDDEISNVVSMFLSRISPEDGQDDQFTQLGSINIFNQDKRIELSSVNATVSGQITDDPDGVSHLSVQLNPNVYQAGLYQCDVYGVDNTGRPAERSQTVFVTSERPELDQLVDKVNDLQSKLECQGTPSPQQEETINFLISLTKNQSELITQLQTDMDQISSTVPDQTVQISNQSDTIDTLSLLMKILLDDKFRISSEHQGHRYLLSKGGWTNADGAQRLCQNYGGYLAKIDDKEEHDFVKNFLDGLPKFSYALISGRDEGHEGTWTYTGSDTVLSYWLWDPKQPGFANEDCLVLVRESHWKMGDYPCYHNDYGGNKFLCEVQVI